MILSIEQVSISSREKKIVDNVSLSIRKGEWYALVGQSGSGKSLLSQSIGQLLHPNLQIEGKIFFKGENLLEFSPKQIQTIRGQKISYIFQDYQGSFTPFRTISQHFEEYQKAHGIHDPKTRQLNAKEELEAVGLDETQRVSIALALLLSPDLLIADEITTALDSVSGHKILELLAKRQKEKGCTILFITHDWRHVKRYATRLAVMKEGKIVESGNKHRILDHPRHEYTKQLIQAAPTLGRGLPSGLPEVENK
jgi:peptide/nickel transport system ATP-binding protein